MKHRIIAIVIITISITILSFIGFHIFPSDSSSKPPEPIENAQILYESAAAAIQQADHITISVATDKTTSFNSDLFLESSKKTVTYQNLHSDSPLIRSEEILTTGSQEIPLEEIFSDGTVYQTINNTNFRYDITADIYLQSHAPAIILDSSLYSDIRGENVDGHYLITFENGQRAENWIKNSKTEFVSSHGNAVIDYDGHLQSSMYVLTYQQGDMQVCATYFVEILQEPQFIVVPDATETHVKIDHPDSIRILEQAANYLVQSESVSSLYEDEIYFEAFGDRRTQNIRIQTVPSESWTVNVDTITKLTNDNRLEQVTEQHKSEIFESNQYSVSSDGQSPIINEQIDKTAMHKYLNNLLVSTVMLPQYVAAAQSEDHETYLRFNYTGTDDFAIFLQKNACEILYQNDTLLSESTPLTTLEFDCFLDVDKVTGLPLASGIHYIGQYTVNGLPSQLQYTAKQSYTFSGQQ